MPFSSHQGEYQRTGTNWKCLLGLVLAHLQLQWIWENSGWQVIGYATESAKMHLFKDARPVIIPQSVAQTVRSPSLRQSPPTMAASCMSASWQTAPAGAADQSEARQRVITAWKVPTDHVALHQAVRDGSSGIRWTQKTADQNNATPRKPTPNYILLNPSTNCSIYTQGITQKLFGDQFTISFSPWLHKKLPL